MRIIDGIKLIGRPAEIPDCSRNDLPQFFVEMGFKVGAEIGVDKGEFSEKFSRAGLKLSAIDPWLYYEDYKDFHGQKKLDSIYEEVKNRLAPYPNCVVVRKTSMQAANDFGSESLDFVYIDGNHEFKYIAEDLSEWTKKVRHGGVVSGHDYFYPKFSTTRPSWDVAYVLKAYIGAYNIPNWYLLGRKESRVGEFRDKRRSWMWIKK